MKTRNKPGDAPRISAFNRRANAFAVIFFAIVIVLAFLPVLLVIMSALSSEESVSLYGYRFIPREFSLEAFRVMARSGSTLPRAFLNSVLITLGGTALGLAVMCPCAYALSRREFRHRKGLMLFLMIPMLFSGGLVASYMVNTQVLRLRNTYLALILPVCSFVSGTEYAVSAQALALDLPFCLIITLVALLPMLIKEKAYKAQGILMVALYAAYLFRSL